ncbi:Ectonucleoside triphosphate diphosphohydrolase 4 [Lamellibrachia satsuma]|nr:Ectonucleoside triphosphate diphosphohydrolase 4 [Lamellibrachia satsuma]
MPEAHPATTGVRLFVVGYALQQECQGADYCTGTNMISSVNRPFLQERRRRHRLCNVQQPIQKYSSQYRSTATNTEVQQPIQKYNNQYRSTATNTEVQQPILKYSNQYRGPISLAIVSESSKMPKLDTEMKNTSLQEPHWACFFGCQYLSNLLNNVASCAPRQSIHLNPDVTTPSATEKSDVEYAVVIDAGSSGSRVRVYNWHERATSRTKLPRFNMTTSKKETPGISSFANNLDGLAKHIGDLVAYAKKNVPQSQTDKTPIYLMATAGIRLLMEAKADAVMGKIHTLLSDKAVNPFKFRRIQSRVLSGEEEGAFAWMAVNYLNNVFPVDGGPLFEESASSSHTEKHEEDRNNSWGIVELGGASLQIAFIPAGSLLANKFPVKVLGTYYPLYVYSYLGFGQNQIIGKIADHLLAKAGGSAADNANKLANPCMLKDDNITREMNGSTIQFMGTWNPAECREVLRSILGTAKCSPKPCGIGSVYQPTIPANKMFFDLSAFAYTIKAIGLLGETFTLSNMTDAAMRYCNKSVDLMEQETGQDNFMSSHCTVAIYMEVLFREVYRFNETAKFSSGFKINGGEPKWPLGAVIYEHERREPTCISPTVTTTAATADSSRFTATTVIYTALLGVLYALRVGQGAPLRGKKPTHRARSPLTVKEDHSWGKKPTHGARSPPTGQEAHSRGKKPTHGERS